MMDQAAPRKEQPRRGTIGYGDFDTVMDVSRKPWPGAISDGRTFTAADVIVGSTMRWGMMFKILPSDRNSLTMSQDWENAPRYNARPPWIKP